MREAVQRKLQNSEEARIETENKRDSLKSQLIAVDKDRERLLKIHEQNKKQIDELARERDILTLNFRRVSLIKSIHSTTNFSKQLLPVNKWTWLKFTSKTRKTLSWRLHPIEMSRQSSVKLYSSWKRRGKSI